MLEELIHYIDADEPIPERLMLAALNASGDGIGTQGRRDAANAILAGAGDYLPDIYYLRALITAELSIEEAKDIIASRKIYINRARHLLPTILKLLGVREEMNLHTALRMIDDCCFDFPNVASAKHYKTVKKTLLEKINNIKDLSNKLYRLIEDAWRHLEIEYNHQKEAYSRKVGIDFGQSYYIEQLRHDLSHLNFAAKLALYKDEIGEESFYVADNRARTHVVECAYRLAVWQGKPQFVTTPGSDFALLSSLIYEMASGDAEVSLAGAINKFARSQLRHQIDRDEAEFQLENSDAYIATVDADNFSHQKEKVARLQKELGFWTAMAARSEWNDLDRSHIMMRLSDVRSN